jgi:hypothetical protein
MTGRTISAAALPVTPEERELALKNDDLARLEEILAEKEMEHADLSADLARFQRDFHERVGVLFRELDELESPHVGSDRCIEEYAAPDIPCVPPSPVAKDLFRKIARIVHPDLCLHVEERAYREKIMGRVNKAYGKGDEESLMRILHEWHSRPEAVEGDDVASELVRVIRRIAQVRRRLDEIDGAMAVVRRSSWFELMMLYDEMRAAGRDMLQEMAEENRRKIEFLRSSRASQERIP